MDRDMIEELCPSEAKPEPATSIRVPEAVLKLGQPIVGSAV